MTKKTKIALICLDRIGKQMAGPGIRYLEMAKSLAKHFDVLLLAPEIDNFDSKIDNLVVKASGSLHPTAKIFPLIKECSHVIAQVLRPDLLAKVKKAGIKYIADLYDPVIIENMEFFRHSTSAFQKHNFDFQRALLLLQLHACDHFLAATDRQQSFYLGLMAGEKIINPASYFANPRLPSLSSLAPFGLPDSPIMPDDNTVLEKQFPGIKPEDKVVYWGGGVWNWFDSLSVVKAIDLISKKRSDIKLFFLGMKHPNPKIPEMEMMKKTLEYAKSQNLLDKFVFMNFDWTPYEERVNYLARVDVAISTHFDNLETHFSFRTRVLDYIWAEIPMVLTRGDFMADLCQRFDLGTVVGYEDVEAIADAITNLCDNQTKIAAIKDNISKIKPMFHWDNITSGIVDYIKKDDNPTAKSVRSLRYRSLIVDFYKSGLNKKLTKLIR